MFSGRRLRELVRERLAAAAEEIITEFELITNQYEEEIDRQRRLLNMRWCSQIKIHRIDFSQQPECKAEEVVTEQQLLNQERNSVLDQEEPEAPQVKEEQEELCISQEGKQLVVKLEADPFNGTLVCEEKQQSEAEPNSEQLLSHKSAGTEIQDEEGSRHVDSGSTKEKEEPKPKKRRLKTGSHSNSDDDCLTSETLCENETDVPQLHDCKEEEVLTVQQLCNQERNSSLDQEEQDAAQVNLHATKQPSTLSKMPSRSSAQLPPAPHQPAVLPPPDYLGLEHVSTRSMAEVSEGWAGMMMPVPQPQPAVLKFSAVRTTAAKATISRPVSAEASTRTLAAAALSTSDQP
ncbi:uncharacterized protein KZ484_010886 [Pholidichthys leucotaenia]